MRTILTASRFAFTLATAGPNDTPAELAPPPKPPEPPPAPVALSRKNRRYNKALNRRLGKRLAKDKTPVKVEVLDDGGIHATVDMRKEKP